MSQQTLPYFGSVILQLEQPRVDANRDIFHHKYSSQESSGSRQLRMYIHSNGTWDVHVRARRHAWPLVWPP